MITVDFRMGDATAKAAQRHPDVRFAIMDTAYYPDALLHIAQQALGLA
jgi:basic membrane lipoprotein Med (substrate-binding protein (PBP1-ABC) superfamily)